MDKTVYRKLCPLALYSCHITLDVISIHHSQAAFFPHIWNHLRHSSTWWSNSFLTRSGHSILPQLRTMVTDLEVLIFTLQTRLETVWAGGHCQQDHVIGRTGILRPPNLTFSATCLHLRNLSINWRSVSLETSLTKFQDSERAVLKKSWRCAVFVKHRKHPPYSQISPLWEREYSPSFFHYQ